MKPIKVYLSKAADTERACTITRFDGLDDVDDARLREIISCFYEQNWEGREKIFDKITKK